MIRWPGTIKPGTVVNDIGAHEDWVPRWWLPQAIPTSKRSCCRAIQPGGMTYKVHLDGYDWSPYFKGDTQQGPRKEFLYWTDDGDLAGLRYNKWKLLFLVQRAHGFDVWQEPFTPLRVPMLVDLHADPFERAEEEAADYSHWRIDRSICSFRLRPLSDSGSSLSGSFRRGRSQRVSAWTRSCKKSLAGR